MIRQLDAQVRRQPTILSLVQPVDVGRHLVVLLGFVMSFAEDQEPARNVREWFLMMRILEVGLGVSLHCNFTYSRS